MMSKNFLKILLRHTKSVIKERYHFLDCGRSLVTTKLVKNFENILHSLSKILEGLCCVSITMTPTTNFIYSQMFGLLHCVISIFKSENLKNCKCLTFIKFYHLTLNKNYQRRYNLVKIYLKYPVV